MKDLVTILVLILTIVAIGCAKPSAHAANMPQPTLAPRAVDATKIFLPLIQSAATDTEAVSATSTPTLIPTNTATPALTSTPLPETTAVPTVAPVIITGASEYFPKISLGKLPAGPRPEKWWNALIPAATIGEKEDLCVSFNNSKEFENVSYGIYNTDKQEYAKVQTVFPQNGKIMRGYSSCFGQLPFSGKGQYEFQIWVGDDLAAALPFEVIFDTPVPTPTPKAAQVNQQATQPSMLGAKLEISPELQGKIDGVYIQRNDLIEKSVWFDVNILSVNPHVPTSFKVEFWLEADGYPPFQLGKFELPEGVKFPVGRPGGLPFRIDWPTDQVVRYSKIPKDILADPASRTFHVKLINATFQ